MRTSIRTIITILATPLPSSTGTITTSMRTRQCPTTTITTITTTSMDITYVWRLSFTSTL
jgi:hypothetical protein